MPLEIREIGALTVYLSTESPSEPLCILASKTITWSTGDVLSILGIHSLFKVFCTKVMRQTIGVKTKNKLLQFANFIL